MLKEKTVVIYDAQQLDDTLEVLDSCCKTAGHVIRDMLAVHRSSLGDENQLLSYVFDAIKEATQDAR